MTELACTRTMHVFVEDTMGATPFCRCGKMRNAWYRRSLLDRLLGRPRPPARSAR